jgi:hypothetical protein
MYEGDFGASEDVAWRNNGGSMAKQFPLKVYRMDFVNYNGDAFRVLFIPAGVQTPHYPAASRPEAQVEFYDLEHMHTPDGQFTGGRYYLDTLMERSDSHKGLILDGGIDKWTLNSGDMQLVMDWLTGLEIAQKRYR